ncbi:hypothetical protein Tco_1530181 [Tanacetum coccineum]
MQEELNEYECLEVWELVLRPDRVMIITLKWIYKVKLDELGVARLKAIRIFLAFAAHMNMAVNQINVKIAFLNGILREEAPKAWYDLLSSFILSQKFSKGTVDPTLFIKREGKDIILMSMMGKMSFFLRLQISQSPEATFLTNPSMLLR